MLRITGYSDKYSAFPGENIKFYVPAPRLCVDNATMVAWSGIERFVNGDKGDSLSIHPKPRWSLAEL